MQPTDRRRERARRVGAAGRGTREAEAPQHEGLIASLRHAADRVADGYVSDGCYGAFVVAAGHLPDVEGFAAVRDRMQREMMRRLDANGFELVADAPATTKVEPATNAVADLRARLCNLFQTFGEADIVSMAAAGFVDGNECRDRALLSLIDTLHEGIADLRGAAIARAFVAFAVLLPDGEERLQWLEKWIADREKKLQTNGIRIASSESASELPAGGEL